MRRYSDMAATLDRALAITPNDVQTQVARAMVDLEWKADTRPLHKAIEFIRTRNPAALRSVAVFGCSVLWLSGIPLPPKRH